VGFDRPIFPQQRQEAAQNRAEPIDAVVTVPGDFQMARMAGGETPRHFVAEHGRERRTRDARYLRFLEGGEVRHAVRE
jgi:hypothetical protein